jgi:hypothetical protein
MAIEMMNGSLHVDVFFDPKDKQYEDNICVCIKEHSPDDEKVFYADETNLLITPEEARKLAELLIEAANLSSHSSR